MNRGEGSVPGVLWCVQSAGRSPPVYLSWFGLVLPALHHTLPTCHLCDRQAIYSSTLAPINGLVNIITTVHIEGSEDHTSTSIYM